MATKRRKRRRSRKRVRTKKGGRRKYKISCKKSRKRKTFKMWYTDAYEPKPSISLEDMPPEIQQNYIFSRLDNFDLDSLSRVSRNIRENAYRLLRRRPVELVDPRMPDEILRHILKNNSLDELENVSKTNKLLRGIAIDIMRERTNNNELHLAIMYNDRLLVDELLENKNHLKNEKNKDGMTPLMLALYNNNIHKDSYYNKKIVESLLYAGVSLFLQDNNGKTVYDKDTYNYDLITRIELENRNIDGLPF